MPLRRPRPVADAPIAELRDGVAIAKGWLLALLAGRPLGGAADVPVAALSREAPGLAAAVLRALVSDTELERLGARGDLADVAARAGALAGATEPAGIVAAVEDLRGSAWRELVAELRAPDARLVADLADRLAHVCGAVAQAALRAPASLSPTAVLAIELDDCERLLAAEPGNGGEELLARAEGALAGALGAACELQRLGLGRYLVVARGADAAGAQVLAERITGAIAGVAAPHSAPLKASIGVAVAWQDGYDAGELAERAERELFAARAAGVPVV
jgi:GGDEF domain-containing protein